MTEAFIAHLWQSTLFAGVAWILAMLLRRNGAHVRYWIWFAASLKFVVPFALFERLGLFLQWHSTAPQVSAQWLTAATRVGQPLALLPALQEQLTESAVTGSNQYAYVGAAVLVLWLAGCVLLTTVWLLRYARVTRLRNKAVPIQLAGCKIRVVSVAGQIEPGLFGIVRPVLLLPAEILQNLSETQLRAIIAHELCHARRKDNLTSAMHMAVQAVFWFHPLIWWLGARLVEERERACDEAVMQQGGKARDYAEGILNVCKLYVESPVQCVSGVSGSDLKKRIEQIMLGRAIRRLSFSRKAAITIAAVSAVAVPVVIGAVFEIADVHPSKTAYWFAQQNPGGAVTHDSFFIYRDATMLRLIQAAYGVTEDAVGGGPSWLKSDLFDVVAKLPKGATPADIKLMLQAMLAERFSLVIHNETRPMPRYVLTVAKGGAKLKRAAPSDDSGCRPQLTGGRGGEGGTASLPNMKVACRNLTSQQIAENLHQMAGGYTTYLTHDVVDATNLEGKWDFDLEFTPPTILPDKGRDGISIFDAVDRQLGLKLGLQDVPVTTLMVASVKRKPTPNSPGVETALALAAPRFEVASIKPVNPDERAFNGLRYAGGSQMRIGGTLRSLIAMAFQIQPNAAKDKIVGLPKSADSERWDITAKLPTTGEGAPNSDGGRPLPPPLSVGLEMLRGLLIDQFELKTHTENREVTVYALALGSGRPKLTKAGESERSDCIPDPNAPRPFPNLWVMANCKNITMAEFARNLEQATGFFDHPIVDETGLQGGWSFLLGFSHQPPPQAPNPNQPPGTITAASDPGYMSGYDAVEKELGLKLVKTKRSIPVIVVDHVDEKPLE